MNRKRVLFVDDEANVLNGIRRMLHGKRDKWDLLFASGGAEALELMATRPVDVLVTDMRMPGMDGSQLLEQVLTRYPRTMRIVLSGQHDLNMVTKSVLQAHQYLSKPCDRETLLGVLELAAFVDGLIPDEKLKERIAFIDKLPTLPRIYREIEQELTKDSPSLQAVAKAIGQDIAMSAKILKLVNSSFFGFCRHISSPEQAATLLGTSTLKALVLYVHIFSIYDQRKLDGFSLQHLWEHSMRSSRLAKRLAVVESCSRNMVDACFIAGLLHDVGKLVLAEIETSSYAAALQHVRQGQGKLDEVEREVFGVTHAQVGAYLLGLWGLPMEIVEAVACHHDHERIGKDNPVAALVHLASLLDHRHCVIHPDQALPEVDQGLLERLGMAERMAHLEMEAQALYAEGSGAVT